MIDFNTAIELIRRNGGFKPNRRDTSYYRTYTMADSRPMQARVSNHGTWLWTWYDKDYDPSYAINACVVYSEDGEDKSDVSVDMEIKDEEGNVVGERESFEVTQYVYNCQILDANDAALINQAVQNIWQNKGFKDPLANTPKHAKVMILRPNETPEIITETKYTKMNKKLIRLTESDLHRIVKESINTIVEDTKAQRKKDPMNQWFKDMDDAQKHRDNMEYITKGGRKPKHWKQHTDEGLVIENEARFLPHLKRTYENLRREYEHWQYANYKPQGMDNAISAIIEAMHSVEDVIKGIEPSDNIPTWEGPQQY